MDDPEIGGLFIPVYDHTRYYLNERMTEWDDTGTRESVMILLERSIDSVSLRNIIHVGRVLIDAKIRYVYLDDIKVIK